jgi:SH3 domain-containing kinase-binding protein 1
LYLAEAIVEFDYQSQEPDELTIKKGESITNIKQMDGGWWEGKLNGRTGVFPDNFVKVNIYV